MKIKIKKCLCLISSRELRFSSGASWRKELLSELTIYLLKKFINHSFSFKRTVRVVSDKVGWDSLGFWYRLNQV